MAQAQSIVTRPGTSFSIPFATPSSPASSSSSTALNSPAPGSPAQLKRPTYIRSAQGTRSPDPAIEDVRNEKQTELVESLKRSVTVVFWYKLNAQPLRIRKEISTFPLFRLSDLDELVAALGLSPRAYVDVYNPQAGTWEQEELCAVHSVESAQRMLYRMRHNLIQGYADGECPGLEAELKLQEESRIPTQLPSKDLDTKNNRKRNAEDLAFYPATKHHKSLSLLPQRVPSPYNSTSLRSDARSASPLFSVTEVQGGELANVLPPAATAPPSSAVSPTYSPASSVHSLSSAVSQPTHEYHYMPNTPISPVQPGLPPKRALPSISSESSLALAVADPQPGPSPRAAQLSLSLQSPPSSRPTLPSQSPETSRPPLPSHSPQSSRPSLSSQSRSSETTAPAPTPTPPALIPGSNAASSSSKAWPHGKSVSEIAAGFREMDELMKDSNVKQAEAFKRVFGVPYKKSTVCNHRKWWRDAPPALVDEWAKMGRDERATWSEFVRVLEGKEPRRMGLAPGMGLGLGLGLGLGGSKGAGALAQAHAAAMNTQAFGSPQGGVLSLGTPLQMPITMQVQGMAMGVPAGTGGQVTDEQPMGSLRPPENEQHRFLG